MNLQHQTDAELAARFWTRLHAAYEAGDKWRWHYMIWKLWSWIQAGELTSDQVRVSFNSYHGTSYATGSQWNTFVTTRLVPIKDRYLSFIAESELA